MADPFLAEIRIFGFQFAPTGWGFCDGTILPIAQNTALFSLLGTTYGGNGQTTFALPNLKGSFPLHAGAGPGLSARDLGEQGGSEVHALTLSQMPVHTHVMNGGTSEPRQASPGGTPGASPARPYHPGPANANAHAAALQVAGAGQPHNNMPPYLTLNFCIALTGVFPQRP
jgi:microcystin-dependent protein